MIPVSYVPPFTGLVCPHCAHPVAHLVVMKRLAMVCRVCGYHWILPAIQRPVGCTITAQTDA